MPEELLRPFSFSELPDADGYIGTPGHIQLHVLRRPRL